MLDYHPAMREYQAEALKWMLKTPQSYLALDMGLGKTLITIEWIKYLISNEGVKGILVLAPIRTIHSTWPDELKKWAPELTYTILHGKDKTESLGKDVDVYLMNYEGLPWLFDGLKRQFRNTKKIPFRGLVIDEGSMVKSSTTKRFKILKKLCEVFPKWRTILSGTPAPNSLLDLWSQYYLLDGGARLGQFITHFKSKYFYQVDRMGFVWSLRAGADELIHESISDITYRLDSEDYLELPDRIDNIIKVDLPKKTMALYKSLEKDFFLELENSEENMEVFNAASLSMKLRQTVQGAIYTGVKLENNKYLTPDGKEVRANPYEILHQAKIKVLKDLVEEANGQGILCAIQFKFELDMILKVFPNTPVIAGGCSATDAAKYIKQWNNGELPLLLCHPASISHGVNLQAGSHIMLWFGLTWSLEQYLQLNKRLHRFGQKNVVVVHHLVARGTIDERVMTALKNKFKGQKALLDYLKGCI